MIDIDSLEALARDVAAIGRPVAANPADILALIAEVRALREDAGRYRWIKGKKVDFDNMAGASYYATQLSNILHNAEDWDAAIDALLTAAQPASGGAK